MRFSDQPLIVRIVTVALLFALSWLGWHWLDAWTQSLPIGTVYVIDAIIVVLIILGLVYDARVKRRLLREARREGDIPRLKDRRQRP